MISEHFFSSLTTSDEVGDFSWRNLNKNKRRSKQKHFISCSYKIWSLILQSYNSSQMSPCPSPVLALSPDRGCSYCRPKPQNNKKYYSIGRGTQRRSPVPRALHPAPRHPASYPYHDLTRSFFRSAMEWRPGTCCRLVFNRLLFLFVYIFFSIWVFWVSNWWTKSETQNCALAQRSLI